MDRPGTPPPYQNTTMKNEDGPDRAFSPSPPPTPTPTPTSKSSIYDKICKNAPFQISCGVLQCLSAIISMILFAIRLHQIAQHVVDLTTSNEAVMGILAAAVLYSVTRLVLRMLIKDGGPMWLKLVWLAADVAFVVAFIMVAELTAPGLHMTSGPCHTSLTVTSIRGGVIDVYNALQCKLPLGTFVLAIFSAIMHVITAIFGPAKEAYQYYKNKRNSRMDGAN